MVNVRPFGLFVELMGFRRNGLVHNSQISEDVVFSREDDDEAKVQAMEYFAPKGSKASLAPWECLHLCLWWDEHVAGLCM